MDCRICDVNQRQFLCETCLKTHVHDLRHQTHYYTTDRDEQVAKASKALAEMIAIPRILRATFSTHQRRVEEIQKVLAKLRKDNEKKKDRIRSLRETLASRRRNLSAAKLQTPMGTYTTSSPAPREVDLLSNVSAANSRARAGLVQELVEVFNVVEVGGRPPIGCKAGTKGEWTIGDLILPVPGDMRRYPPDHINAVLTHTIHFVSLLTFYLGIKLPFEVIWSGGKLGVGVPYIGAAKGAEAGGWARWYSKHPLHFSTSLIPEPILPSQLALSPTDSDIHLPPLNAGLAENAKMSISVLASDPPASAPQSSFTTAIAMLLFDVSYLAYTQNMEVPLSQAGDVLSNLWMVCCSSELGRKSHETYPYLPAPTPPSFSLDFSQLLQAAVANPASKTRTNRVGNVRVFNNKSERLGGLSTSAGQRFDEVVERDEEGWDMVSDDV